MNLLTHFLESERRELTENNIRLTAIGQIERLPEKVRRALDRTMDLTRDNTAMQLNLALSYGGRSEIVRMVKTVVAKALAGDMGPEDIDENTLAEYLYTGGLPDPDLLIRTSGEMRVSNFLLWQIAYSEIHVTDTLWPDFTREEFVEILKAYQRRERRFGKI